MTGTSRQALLKMASRIGVVILVMTGLSYYHLMETSAARVKSNLAVYISERESRERVSFDLAEKNHKIIEEEFISRYQAYLTDPNTDKQYADLIKKYPDGAYRNRDPKFNGKREAGIYISSEKAVDSKFKASILASYDVCNRLGVAYHSLFQDTYFSFKENAIVLYWPEFPNWVLDTKADYNVAKQEYHLISRFRDVKESRKTTWTGLFYDPVSKTWMVTASTPIYLEGQYIASVHHDLMVNEIFARTLDAHLEGVTHYFIVRDDGRLILHPNHSDNIVKGEGSFNVAASDDEVLKAQFQEIIRMPSNTNVVDSPDGSGYLTAAKIPGPNWYLATVYPKSLIQKMVAKNAMFILALGLISLLLEVLIIYSVFRKFEGIINQRTRELSQASKMSALGEMAGGVAHEINTPLATIKLLSSQVAKEIQSDIPDLESLTNHIQKIENTAERVAKIVKGLKTFARDGSSDPFEQVSARTLIDDTVVFCSEQMQKNLIELRINIPQVDIFLSCRPVQVSQVLLNLLANAQDAVREVPEKWIQVTVLEDATQVQFVVSDSGSGISKNARKKIFQPFFTTKTLGKGTGLGLSISLGIIRSHQGELYLDEKSRHTTFVIRLPKGQSEKVKNSA